MLSNGQKDERSVATDDPSSNSVGKIITRKIEIDHLIILHFFPLGLLAAS
ncbi:MAG: hypothetical protein WDN26_00985 [Chitinophagaceae bacterium]